MATNNKTQKKHRLLQRHKDVVNALETEGDFLVDAAPDKVFLRLPWARGGVTDMTTITLTRVAEGRYHLHPPRGEYRCRTSHFEFYEPELRMSRNKIRIMSLVRRLKRSAVWDLVENREGFVMLNDGNKSVDKRLLGKELRTLLDVVKG